MKTTGRTNSGVKCASGTGRIAIYTSDKLVTSKELAVAVNWRNPHVDLTQFLHSLGLVDVVVDAGCRREEICETYRPFNLAKVILLEEEVGLWRPALAWTEAGVETVRELVKILGSSNDRNAIAGAVIDAVWERRIKTSEPFCGFNKEEFMARLRNKIPR